MTADAPTRVSARLPRQGEIPVLELEGVTKTYGAEPPIPALQGVSFSVFAVLMVFGVALILADIVNPVNIAG